AVSYEDCKGGNGDFQPFWWFARWRYVRPHAANRRIGPPERSMSEPLPARETMEFDVLIVGAGPAGLAAAIRLKQLAPDTNVVVVEKGSEVGAHVLSGAVIDPIGLDQLIPDWRSEDAPIKTKVSEDRFYWLSASRAVRSPNFVMPPLMNNGGNYVVS